MRQDNPVDLLAEEDNTRTHLHVSAGEAASGHEEDRTTEGVRQGHTGDHVRYILAVSLAGVAAALIAAYWYFMR